MAIKREALLKTVEQLTTNYEEEDLFLPKRGKKLPDRSEVITVTRELKRAIFPGYFSDESCSSIFPEYYAGYRLNQLYDILKAQIQIALAYRDPEKDMSVPADEICARFFAKLPAIQKALLKDAQAGFDGDPAAKSREEIIFSYPGFYAIYVYRLAHELYLEKVPFIPRIMTEYAHGRTGIDINPGATIGEYFFIDHGTGVVIGETTEIGDNVKLYQGVTLGALSTRLGQQLSNVKRHPTIKNNVTIYSNSTVLGGETVIGENTIIGGNTFITESVPADTKVSAKSPELVIKRTKEVRETSLWDWEI